MANLKLYLPAIIWLVVILILSGYPGNQLPKIAVWQFDKWVHTLMYGVLSFLVLIPYSKQFLVKGNRFKIGLFIILFGIFYGGFMEILQNNIFINRSGNWIDFIANSLGAIIGVVTYPIMIKIVPINRWLKIK
ncbi:MAG: VanZ family protein [Flavobacteriales bacterium]|nr:VanZ family protein [Flavobacteriales bacterium]